MDKIDKYLNEANVMGRDFKSAEDAYNKRYSNIQKLIKELSINLKKHEKNFKKEITNWAMAGDLGRLESDLKDILEYFV